MSTFIMASKPAMGNRLPIIPINQFFSSKTWIEGSAIEQLKQLANLPGAISISAFPDLHPGKYGPVGIAFLADKIYPQLIGSDIGCGMSLFLLNMKAQRIKVEKTAKQMRLLESEADWREFYDPQQDDMDILSNDFASSLGTIGGGNHFCELQVIEQVFQEDLDKSCAYLLVHSGSRGMGTRIFENYLNAFSGVNHNSLEGKEYLRVHNKAVKWASINRYIVALRTAKYLGCDITPISDVPHNLLEQTTEGWLHRKGAAQAKSGIIPIAGSRDSLSYAVKISENIKDSLMSVSHGSGRKFDRSSMTGRISTKKSNRQALCRNQWGGQIICEDNRLLFEEAPVAYKHSQSIINELQSFGLIEPIAAFRPVVTFKKAKIDPANVNKVKEKWKRQ